MFFREACSFFPGLFLVRVRVIIGGGMGVVIGGVGMEGGRLEVMGDRPVEEVALSILVGKVAVEEVTVEEALEEVALTTLVGKVTISPRGFLGSCHARLG